eukprot:gene6410-biopygen12647
MDYSQLNHEVAPPQALGQGVCCRFLSTRGNPEIVRRRGPLPLPRGELRRARSPSAAIAARAGDGVVRRARGGGVGDARLRHRLAVAAVARRMGNGGADGEWGSGWGMGEANGEWGSAWGSAPLSPAGGEP